ncbi:MAG: bifunctional glutamate--cysteine ligase GshA/glutathione synthetase GshB, partial [Bacteroidales bacterium]
MDKLYKKARHLMLEGLFGLEKENLRITPSAELALTSHPDLFGDKTINPFITTDFSESQIEMITPPLPGIKEALGFMETIHDIVSESIGDELLWPQSLPPLIPEEKLIPIAEYGHAQHELRLYREHLAQIYGRKRQLMCGIHFNFSLSDAWFNLVLKDNDQHLTLAKLKEVTYMKMLRNFMRYRWSLVWLFGASPIAEAGYRVKLIGSDSERAMKTGQSISLRNGPLGYRNQEDFILDYSSLDNYHRNIDLFVYEGRIKSRKELYLPVRLKFLDKDKGAPSYIEIRTIDLDPLEKAGVSPEALYFCHILLLYSLIKEENDTFDHAAQLEANKKSDFAASFGRCKECTFGSESENLLQQAQNLVEDIYESLLPYNIWSNRIYADVWKKISELTFNPDMRCGIEVYKGCMDEGYLNYFLRKSQRYKAESVEKGYQFHGLEDMELSTQLILKAAVRRGIQFEIIDRKENFIRLFNREKEECIVQATKTGLDNYVSILKMENKAVTKLLLDRKGIHTPAGKEYSDPINAFHDYGFFKNESVVVKPKSTNFGIGITILKYPYKQEDFEWSIKQAFKHDSNVLIERFAPGKEYRFLVIENEVVGVLHRVPANVTGDGIRTIRQLVEIKNLDPLRGRGYRTPLEKIRLGKDEEMFLKLQGLDFESIPNQGETIFLRENSNISTGGDSIDYSDQMHESYKAIAIRAARVLNVAITGVDIMITDINSEANVTNYAIIEMNFNPAIHIHCYPYKG